MAVHYDEAKDCHFVKFVLNIDGKRLRKTKRLPRGITYDEAVFIERRMMAAHDPYRDLRERLLALPDDPKGHGCVYAARAVSGSGPVKIGMTRRNINQRLHSFNVTATDRWVEIASVKVRCPQAVEGVIHARLHKSRIATNRELFNVETQEILELFGVVADAIEHIDPAYEVGFRAMMESAKDAA